MSHPEPADIEAMDDRDPVSTLGPEALTHPGRISHVITELSPCLTVEDFPTAVEMASIGRARGQSVVWPDGKAIGAIGSAWSQGVMASYRAGR